MNSRSGGSGVIDGRRSAPRFTGAAKHMTRYAPDKDRPASTSQLTRFAQEHSRGKHDDVAASRAIIQRTETNTASAPSAAPVRPPVPPQRTLPETEGVPVAETQPLRSTQADLYSDAPITISILKRALPRRFADIETGKTLGSKTPAKQSAQFGLTHAIRPLKSLFPYDPT